MRLLLCLEVMATAPMLALTVLAMLVDSNPAAQWVVMLMDSNTSTVVTAETSRHHG